MKLYTENEVRRIIKIAFWQDFENGTSEEDVIDMAHSINLPTDDAIEIQFTLKTKSNECIQGVKQV